MKRYIIIGISTEVGKTVVSAVICEALNGFYWKPIQCGTPQDRLFIETMRSAKGKTFPESYLFKHPLSPHLAAKKEKRTIALKEIQIPACREPLIIEGTGGILSPLTFTSTWLDMAKDWEAMWVLVYRSYLGSFNHFLLTCEVLLSKKIPLSGVIFNGHIEKQCEEMLLLQAKTKCIGRIPKNCLITQPFIQGLAKQWQTALLGL